MTTTLTPADTAARDTVTAWRLSDAPGRYGAILGNWTTSSDGRHITARIHGRNAEAALKWFGGGSYPLLLAGPEPQQPQLTYTDTGIQVAWRTSGVWVQLTAA